METLREEWHNTIYRTTAIYVSVLVTLIFSFQMYRYFHDLPSHKVTCTASLALIDYVPFLKEIFDDT